jgi:hypothetical protein
VACQNVRIRNVKLIGLWRYNTDGIDFVNCRHCTLEDSFIRSFDDSVAIKGFTRYGSFIFRTQIREDGLFSDDEPFEDFTAMQLQLGEYECGIHLIQDIRVSRCVIWNDWGRALEIGLETAADEICDILFEDCDIIHAVDVAMDIQNGDRALCRDIRFHDIRIELDDDFTRPSIQESRGQSYDPNPEAVKASRVPRTGNGSGSGGGMPSVLNDPSLIVLEIVNTVVSVDKCRGRTENIHFKDIQVTARDIPPSRMSGHDAEHKVQGVTIENLWINGRRILRPEDGGIRIEDFVEDVRFI